MSRVGIFNRQRGQKLGLNKKLCACPVGSAYRTGVENWRIYKPVELIKLPHRLLNSKERVFQLRGKFVMCIRFHIIEKFFSQIF